jgi:dienelactone hydrolase
MPTEWAVSENGRIFFDNNYKNLYFGTAPKPLEKPKDTLTVDEKVSIDIWNWKDKLLQPQQLKNRSKELKRTYLAQYNIVKKKMTQIADLNMSEVSMLEKGPNNYAIGKSADKYLKLISWEGKNYADIYLIDLKSGNRTLIKNKVWSDVALSPAENYLFWYNSDELGWNIYNIKKKKIRNITNNIQSNFYDELDDHPDIKYPYGTAGWMKNDKAILIYDHYDIWKINLQEKNTPINITNNYGKKNKTIFRYKALDNNYDLIEETNLILSAESEKTKQTGYYKINAKKTTSPEKLVFGNYNYIGRGYLSKAKNSNNIIFKKESLSVYPDLWISNLNFENPKRISNTNPQQKDYNWGTVDLVHWTSLDGKELDGLLYKPENFDPNKKYPMLVYFYERMSDYRFKHIYPKPSRSSINFLHFISNEYLVFIPDIVYKDGYPGESSVNAVVSGTMNLIEKYNFVNKDKIGIQGQSWGGYQVAYLVTQTDLYAAAWAGAPVSNMTSAYGGIRWGTGMSRMFQYEKTQSRLGGTLWEKPRQYVENSPIFYADKIKTPLAIMHNDKDGAVPWYQGIELFVALRRLDKPCWLLNYNGAPHNLSRRADSKDISIRLSQFFDHFLKDAPAPVWLEYGIPATKKGEEFGFELVE